MAIPTVYAKIKPGDFTLKPYIVHKEYVLSSATLVSTASGYNIVDGVHTSLKTPIGSAKAANDPTNSFDGSYQHVVWQSINHRYYKFPYDSYATFEHANRRYTWKFLNYSASIFSAPYMDFGERIRPGSVEVSNSSHAFVLRDDTNGNIYDISIDSGSFTKNYNVVAYWGFNDQFRHFRYLDGLREEGSLKYESRVFEPDEKSEIKNIYFDVGVNGTGMEAQFDGNSYILTHHRPEFNPANNEQFSISFWVKATTSQANEDDTRNVIISKRGTVRQLVYGKNEKYNKNDLLVTTKHISSSIEDRPTSVYPYHIEMFNSSAGSEAGKIRVLQSNGIRTSEVSSSAILDGNYHHVAVVYDDSLIKLYVDATLQSSASRLDFNEDIFNNHSIVFGAFDRTGKQSFSGSLDEIRFYDTALTPANIATLADSSSMAMYQTAVVGNVFYRQGNIVISSLFPTYQNAFKGNWTVKYEGTHTVYQYEVLCRVKKGSFNMTYNPTARMSYKSDLLIPDMTGSGMMPYATTIGLYNDKGDLVAVAKLAQPVQMRDDVDINFVVRWDV
jgi:hypothetical protein